MSKSDMDGAVALITGGASGIGKALGEACAAQGAKVWLADRQVDEARAVAKGIRARGGEAEARELDVRDADAWLALAAEIVAKDGRVDYFFNNAGIGVAGEVERYERRDWDDVLDVNVRGVTYGIQAIYPRMISTRSGHIINTASMAGLLPMPGSASYTASKHAVVGISKAMRVEAAVHGVRVSVLCPGAIRTPILTGGKYGRNEHLDIDAEKMAALWDRVRPMDPARFAEEVLAAVARNEAYIIVPRWWRAVWLLHRVSPELMLRAGGVMLKEMRRAASRTRTTGAGATASSSPERPMESRK